VAGVAAQEDDRLLQGTLRFVFQGLVQPGAERGMLPISQDLLRQLIRRATMSASPASIALRGMPSNLAVPGSCTQHDSASP